MVSELRDGRPQSTRLRFFTTLLALALAFPFALSQSPGTPCLTPADCPASFCIHGVCCWTPCNGTCVACNTPGNLGTCQNELVGLDSNRRCNTSSTCDGNGVCKDLNGRVCFDGSECASAYCVDQTCCESNCSSLCHACNVAGNLGQCIPVPRGTDPQIECQAGRCDGAGGCVTLTGSNCSNASQCLSGFCEQGICCGSLCNQGCASCALSATMGTCTNLPLNSVDASCPAPGYCNGGGVCKKAPGIPCNGNSECQTNICTKGVCCTSLCNGTCISCNISTSLGVCTNISRLTGDTNCSSPRTCNGLGACKTLNGSICTTSAECLSGNCFDGVCCQSTCNSKCMSCNQPGSVGLCKNVPFGEDDLSSVLGNCSGASFSCDGNGTCVKAIGNCSKPSDCLFSVCEDGNCCNNSCGICATCTSNGTCLPMQVNSYDPLCPNGTGCNGAGQCKSLPGTSCTNATTCITGFCFQNICCTSTCATLCKACDVMGSLGICTNLGIGSVTSQCNGSSACDGSGSCKSSNGQGCGNPSECVSTQCVDGICCNSSCTKTCATCNLAGSEGVCANAPYGSADNNAVGVCTGANVCDGNGACRKMTGTTCAANLECASGICNDIRCCDVDCRGPCRRCDLNGTIGQCTFSDFNLTDPLCLPSEICSSTGTCVRPRGANCTSPLDCITGYCGHGTCCDLPCSGDCNECSTGFCLDLPSQSPCGPGLAGECSTPPSGFCILPIGLNCSNNSECLSGFCSRGVCCESDCSASPCTACDLPLTLGICTNISLGSPSRGVCTTGLCDGLGACVVVSPQFVNISNCVDGTPGPTPGVVCVGGSFVALTGIVISNDTDIDVGVLIQGNVSVGNASILNVINIPIFIEGSLYIESSSTLDLLNSSSSFVTGDLVMAEGTFTRVNSSNATTSSLRVDGCVRLSGNLRVVIPRSSPNKGSLVVLDYGCLESNYDQIEFVTDPEDPRKLCTSRADYGVSHLMVAYNIGLDCLSQTATPKSLNLSFLISFCVLAIFGRDFRRKL